MIFHSHRFLLGIELVNTLCLYGCMYDCMYVCMYVYAQYTYECMCGSIFDNIIITDSVAEASAFAFSQAARDAEKAMHDAAEAEKVAAEKAERDAAAALDQADDQGHDEL